MIEKTTIKGFLSLTVLLAIGCASELEFVTSTGIGPDKWSSVWLIKRHIRPDAKIKILPDPGIIPTKSLAFDVPQATLRRTPDSTTYEKLLAEFKINDAVATRLGQVISDIEINSWGIKELPESRYIETAFRELQKRHGRESVPQECYMAFFDQVASVIERDGRTTLQQLLPDVACTTKQQPDRKAHVAEIPAKKILNKIGGMVTKPAQGKRLSRLW